MSYLYHNKGIYQSNGKLFANKIDAIFEANSSNTYVEWDYHDDIFSKYKWDVNPTIELEELYKQRALQLREAYDHLVLFFSGGADSWNILHAFIKNGIKLDEIYMFGAFEAEQSQLTILGADRTPGYYTREIQQSLSLVKALVENKNIKINVYDWTQDILNAVNNRDWFYTAGVRFDPTCTVRSKFHKIFKEHTELSHRGKQVGFIYGIDKPRLIRDDANIYFAFLDVIMTTGTLPTNDILGEYWENDEYFYWTPNFPELAIKQSHVVVKWLTANKKLHLIKHINDIGGFHDEAYYDAVNYCIYPNWNADIWQIKKPTNAIYNELSKWFFQPEYSEAKLKWESSLTELERLCGKQWFNDNTVTKGMRGHLSPLYKIDSYK